MNANKGKWRKFTILKRSAKLAKALPETLPFSPKTLWRMAGKYKRVILKPVHGSGGLGVIQLTALGRETYHIHSDRQQKILRGKKDTYRFLQKKIGFTPFIIQQKISLAQVNGRPFDLRIMVQRRKDTPWTVTGRLAKVAGKGYIVTNTARSRGTVLPVNTAIRKSSLSGHSLPALIRNIDQIALKASKRLHKAYRWLRMTGLDMGIDSKGKIWIIEANFAPALSLFLRLKDKTMYRLILSFK